MKILILAASNQELNCLNPLTFPNDSFCTHANSNALVFYCKTIGIGQTSIEINLPPLLSSLSPDIVLLFGSSGGLCPNLAPGTFFIPTSVLHVEENNLTCFDFFANESFFLPWFLEESLESPAFGRTITVSDFIHNPTQKNFLQKTFNVSAVDMETFFVLKICSINSIPLLVIRIVIDNFFDTNLSIADYLNMERNIFLRKGHFIKEVMNQIFARLFANLHDP